MLYMIVAALCGAAVMALELLGSRLLAPDFGSSIHVWGSLIGTFLAALSVGYWIGGVVADRYPFLAVLSIFVFVAAAATCALPFAAGPVTRWISTAVEDVRMGSLLSCVVLFMVPGAALGTVSPFLIRMSAKSVGTTGRAAGGIYAVSTVGSIVGTLATAFYLIAVLPVSRILLVVGALLWGVGIVLLAASRWSKAGIALVVALGFLAVAQTPPALAQAESWREVYRADTLYHNIRVVDENGVRYLMFGRTSQSALDLRNPTNNVFRYVDVFHLGPILKPDMKRVLFIGLGGGTGPSQFRRLYPELTIDVAEIDPEVVRIAARFFRFKTDSQLKVDVRDGRMFLRRTRNKYDMIVLDAYYADGVPFHLTTKEFMRLVWDRLTPGGILMANVIGSMEGRRSELMRSQYRTILEAFGNCLYIPVLEEDEKELNPFMRRNIMLISVKGRALSLDDVRAKVKSSNSPKKRILETIMAAVPSVPPKATNVPVLTDDYAPVDNLLHID